MTTLLVAAVGPALAAQVDLDDAPPQVWRSDNDGAGSGLDADLIDGLDLSVILASINGDVGAEREAREENNTLIRNSLAVEAATRADADKRLRDHAEWVGGAQNATRDALAAEISDEDLARAQNDTALAAGIAAEAAARARADDEIWAALRSLEERINATLPAASVYVATTSSAFGGTCDMRLLAVPGLSVTVNTSAASILDISSSTNAGISGQSQNAIRVDGVFIEQSNDVFDLNGRVTFHAAWTMQVEPGTHTVEVLYRCMPGKSMTFDNIGRLVVRVLPWA